MPRCGPPVLVRRYCADRQIASANPPCLPTAAQRHLNTLGAPLCLEHAEAAIADTYAAFA